MYAKTLTRIFSQGGRKRDGERGEVTEWTQAHTHTHKHKWTNEGNCGNDGNNKRADRASCGAVTSRDELLNDKRAEAVPLNGVSCVNSLDSIDEGCVLLEIRQDSLDIITSLEEGRKA